MQETIQAIKDVWATAVALGYQPMPLVVAVVAMLGARSYFEPDVLAVNTVEAAKRMGWIKLGIFVGVTAVNGLIQVGLAKPAFAFDWCLSVGFSVVNAIGGYIVSSSRPVRNFIKNGLFAGGAAVPPADGKP